MNYFKYLIVLFIGIYIDSHFSQSYIDKGVQTTSNKPTETLESVQINDHLIYNEQNR